MHVPGAAPAPRSGARGVARIAGPRTPAQSAPRGAAAHRSVGTPAHPRQTSAASTRPTDTRQPAMAVRSSRPRSGLLPASIDPSAIAGTISARHDDAARAAVIQNQVHPRPRVKATSRSRSSSESKRRRVVPSAQRCGASARLAVTGPVQPLLRQGRPQPSGLPRSFAGHVAGTEAARLLQPGDGFGHVRNGCPFLRLLVNTHGDAEGLDVSGRRASISPHKFRQPYTVRTLFFVRSRVVSTNRMICQFEFIPSHAEYLARSLGSEQQDPEDTRTRRWSFERRP